MPAKDRNLEKKARVPAKRVFTDREEPRKAFWDTYEKACAHHDDYNVLHFYGRGGIGKSSLLRELHRQLLEKQAYCVFYDMEEGTEMRRILTRLRNMLQRQYPNDFRFDYFDLTLLKFSELAGERNELVEKEDKTIIESNPLLSALMEGASLVPGVSVISSVVDKLTKGYHYYKDISEHYRKTLTEKAARVNDLSMSQLLDLMPEFFGQDLDECCKKLGKPVVFFLDTYERLVNYMSDVGVVGQEDRWLRDTIIQYTHNSVWVVAGRDRLRWQEIDPNWKDDPYYRDHILGQLGKADSLHYLREAGITDPELGAGIFTLTDGDPLYLDLCVSTWQDLRTEGRTPTLPDFGNQAELVSRYLRYMDAAHRDLVELLACFGKWTDAEVRRQAPELLGSFSETVYRTVVESSLVQADGAGGFYLHRVVRSAILAQMPEARVQILLGKLSEDSAKEETEFSLDYVAVLDKDLEQLIEGLKKGIEVSTKAVDAKISKLNKQSNYREVCRVLTPLYQYEESVNFRDEKVSWELEEYLWALNYTNQQESFLAQAEKLYKAYAANHVSGGPWLRICGTRINAYQINGRYEETLILAQTLKAEMERLGQTGPEYTRNMRSIGSALANLGHYTEAIPILEEALSRAKGEIAQGQRGRWHLHDNLKFLGQCCGAVGEPERALQLYEEALQISRETYGETHLITLNDMYAVAYRSGRLGQTDKEEELLLQILDIYTRVYGDFDANGLDVKASLAFLRRSQKRYQEAFDLDREVLEARKKLSTKNTPEGKENISRTYRNLTEDLYYQKKYTEALAVAKEGLAYAEEKLSMEHESTLRLLYWIGFCCRNLEDYAGAEQADRKLLERLKPQVKTQGNWTVEIYEHLVRDLFGQGKYEEALGMCQEGMPLAEARLSQGSKYAISVLEWPGYCFRKLKRYQEALEADKHCWELEKKVLGENDKRTLQHKGNLDFDEKKLKEAASKSAAPPKAASAGIILRCVQSFQSDFFIETPSETLIFDWHKGALPHIRRDKPLHIFISHTHPDHYDESILSLAEQFEDVSIYLGYDYSDEDFNEFLERLPEKIYDTISCFQGEQRLLTDFGSVETLNSTDDGVAFLVKTKNLTLFHGGDLFPWKGSEAKFQAYTAPLRGVHIDYAMLPLDSRFPEAAERCVTRYLQLADIRYFTPMHMWEKPETASSFAQKHPALCPKMIAQNPGNIPICQSIQLLRPYTIKI